MSCHVADGKKGLTHDELMGMIKHNKQVRPALLPVYRLHTAVDAFPLPGTVYE